MTDVTIRELRNHAGEVVDRAAQGEQITVTLQACQWLSYALSAGDRSPLRLC